ncbi:MAG: methyl-accepting chemotaxis protein [Deltaproteobacteria bacterium]|nr:methyl-accepting chemotaxis protein [Deltaproteobacteria bacterium]
MMSKDDVLKPPKPFKQRYFVARELQFSIALLIVLALLGGITLQALSSALIDYFGLNTPILGIFLIFGYVGIIVLLAIFFTHRLVGPFKRLEYEMKLISAGDIAKRLTIRNKDDLHVRNFVKYTNEFISNFEEMSKEYNMLNSTVSKKIDEITQELAKDNFDCKKLSEELIVLQKQVHKFREKW